MTRSPEFSVRPSAALAPLGRPLRIHQFELVAGQKLVREVVCRIAREKDIAPLAVTSNTSYNSISVTYEKQNLQPGMDPPDPPVAASTYQPARSHLAQAAKARRRGDQEFGLCPPL